MRPLVKGFSAAAVLAVVLTAAPSSRANGYLVARFGSDHGTPASANPFAVYFNPAAMGGTTGTHISLDVAPVLRFASYERTPDALGDPTLADPNNTSDVAQRYRAANTGKANLTNVLALAFLGATTDLGIKQSPLRLGYGLYVPYGGIASWNKRTDAIAGDPLAPGARDGAQRWHNIEGQLLSIYNTLAASFTVDAARLSFGVSGSFVHHTIDTIRARNIPLNDDRIQGFSGGFSEGRTRLTAGGNNFGLAGGIYWEPLPDRSLRLGASYTSQPGLGSMRLKGKLTPQDGTNPARNPEEDVDFLQAFPDIVRFGLGYRVSEKVDLKADVEYVRWSTLKNQCVVAPGANCDINPADGGDLSGGKVILNIPRNWKDVVAARGGFGYFVQPQTELFASAAFSTSPVPKSTIDAAALDSFRIYGTVGARHEFSEHFAFAGSFNAIHFLPVDTQGQSNTNLLQNPSRSPSADGKYSSEIFFVNLNGTYRF